jgi:alpha-N-arabinofuranosidase
MSCGLQVLDDNSLGTHEFLELCAAIGAEPYLAGNLGSGSPQEMCDWLEYCNTARDTVLGRERRANGVSQPFGVKLWGVGNENWGCGGSFDAQTYAHEYRRFATMLRHVDPLAELVVCGHDDAWNARLLDSLGAHLNLADHLSIHRYWGRGGPALEFSDEQFYTLLADAQATEAFVQYTAELIAQASGDGRRMGIALDEWGVWAPESRRVPEPPAHPYEQPSTLRDALAVGIALEGFHRQCNVLTMANLAQVVNVLQAVVVTDGARMFCTPTYHAFRLHAAHMGAVALPVDSSLGDSLPDGSPAVTGTASQGGDGLTVTLINRHRSRAADVCVDVGVDVGSATGQILTADTPRATNCADEPDRVALRELAVVAENRRACRVVLPAHSMATIRVTTSS